MRSMWASRRRAIISGLFDRPLRARQSRGVYQSHLLPVNMTGPFLLVPMAILNGEAAASHAAGIGFALVAILAAVLAWITHRSYQATGNWKLLFVFMAFIVFLLKSVLFTWNEFQSPHPIHHDVVLLVVAALDLIIILLLVIPFLVRRER